MPIVNRIAEFAEDMKAWRRHLHQNPELSFQEYNTADFIENELKKLNIPSKRLANTGIVALIKGNNPESKTIALRGDIDALPIENSLITNFPFNLPTTSSTSFLCKPNSCTFRPVKVASYLLPI